MAEPTQSYLELESETRQTNPGFQSALNYIREHARSERQPQNRLGVVHRPLQNQKGHSKQHHQHPKRLVQPPPRPHRSNRAHHPRQC